MREARPPIQAAVLPDRAALTFFAQGKSSPKGNRSPDPIYLASITAQCFSEGEIDGTIKSS